MKRRFIFIALALLLISCGGNDIPLVSPDQLQAPTEVILPTSTATNTPSPSPTVEPTLTIEPTIIVSPASTVNPCDGALFANLVGSSGGGKSNNGASVFIVNNTRASITVTLYLSKNDFGQCGSVSYVLAQKQSVSIINQLPFGCYYASAYINDPKKPSRASGGPACITGPDRTTITVSANKIKITGP